MLARRKIAKEHEDDDGAAGLRLGHATAGADRAVAAGSSVMGNPPHPPARRPGLIRWFWYALGGRLPGRYREWVLYDLTCRTWPLRHLARLLTQLAPVAAVLIAAVPGPLWVRVMGALGGSIVGLLYSFVFLYEATEHRAAKAGYPHGTLRVVREERRADMSLERAAHDFDRTWRGRT
jgi:hypothetical protein